MRRAQALKSYKAPNLQDRTAEKSPEELVALLFDTACSSVLKSKNALSKGELEMFHESTSKAMQIVLGLREILDMEEGGELAERLADTYTSIAASIFKAKRERNDSDLGKIYLALAELRGAWQTVSGASETSRVTDK